MMVGVGGGGGQVWEEMNSQDVDVICLSCRVTGMKSLYINPSIDGFLVWSGTYLTMASWYEVVPYLTVASWCEVVPYLAGRLLV